MSSKRFRPSPKMLWLKRQKSLSQTSFPTRSDQEIKIVPQAEALQTHVDAKRHHEKSRMDGHCSASLQYFKKSFLLPIGKSYHLSVQNCFLVSYRLISYDLLPGLLSFKFIAYSLPYVLHYYKNCDFTRPIFFAFSIIQIYVKQIQFVKIILFVSPTSCM